MKNGSKRRKSYDYLVIFFSYAILWFHSGVSAQNTEQNPSLFIPLGSYMEKVPLYIIHANKAENIITYPVSRYHTDPSLSLDCWRDGFDIIKDSDKFSCNRSVSKPIVDAARFLYSVLIPYGSYLDSCISILKTREMVNNEIRSFIYATCKNNPLTRGYIWANDRDNVIKQKVDVTDCPMDHLVNTNGNITCANEPKTRRQIVTGSYLKQRCFAGESFYNSDEDTLYSRCGSTEYHNNSRQLSNITECLDLGGDIIFRADELHCDLSSSAAEIAKIHTASAFIPAGNYSISCAKIAYYPCAGINNSGLLVAQCLTGIASDSNPPYTQLEDGANDCRMSDLGYISNINGVLTCDPEVIFSGDEPTQGSDLVDALRCISE